MTNPKRESDLGPIECFFSCGRPGVWMLGLTIDGQVDGADWVPYFLCEFHMEETQRDRDKIIDSLLQLGFLRNAPRDDVGIVWVSAESVRKSL